MSKLNLRPLNQRLLVIVTGVCVCSFYVCVGGVGGSQFLHLRFISPNFIQAMISTAGAFSIHHIVGLFFRFQASKLNMT